MSSSPTKIYEFHEFRLDAAKRLLSRGGETLSVTPKAFDTLLYLVENCGKLIDKDELMRGVWADTIVEENNLSQNISILRRVLGEKKDEHRFIVTVPGRGFRFVADVRSVTRMTAPARIRSIAVLPFKPLVAGNRDEVLEIGMTDTLISKLGGEDIIVRPLSSVRHFHTIEQDALTISHELGVDAVLEGTILNFDGRIRVSSRLVRAADGAHIWSEIFDEKFTDIFKVQDSISERVASALQMRLAKNEKGLSTSNIRAYQAHIKGRLHGDRFTLPEIKLAIGYFEEAINLDPNYALAYAGLADACLRLALLNNIPTLVALPRAKAAALRATELAPRNADVFANFAWIVFWYEWNWDAAEEYCRRAIELDPNNSFARMVYAHLLSNTGRSADALAQIRLSRELDPTSIFYQANEGQILLFAGRIDEALDTLNGAIETNPNFWLNHLFVSRVYHEKQMLKEAVAALAKAQELFPSNTESTALLGYALAMAGNRIDAETIRNDLIELANREYVAQYNLAMIHNGIGESEKALDYLERAFAERNVLMVFLKVEPKWNNLRTERRFINLMKRMNFP